MPSSKIPFVYFYSTHGIIPTRQDISDLDRHVERRCALYRHLGLPPGVFRCTSVLEFGPGSGHNAVVTGLLGPDRYLLVDGNPPSLHSTKKVLEQYCSGLNFELRQSSILEFHSKEKFDIVLCEAVIPTQKNPPVFLRHVASFVRPGGVVVFTCMDPISLLPEMLRRWLAWNLVGDVSDFNGKVARLVEFFRPDLAALPGMSRRPEDWVIDQILHPWVGPLFSIPQALTALGSRGAVLGCSPRFLLDWRWYKSIVGSQSADISFAIDSYYELGLNLMDFRVRLPQIRQSVVRRAVEISQTIYDGVFARERGLAGFSRRQMLPHLLSLQKLLRDQSPKTARSLKSFIRYLQSDMSKESDLAEFHKWWGRGQQYVSCVMR
jgi:SAM-dependent methyltransferase